MADENVKETQTNQEMQKENLTAKTEELKKEINVLKGKLTTFEEKKENLLKKVDDEISKTLYAKKTEIENTYGEILTEAEKRLEVAKKEKEKERKKNIDNLVAQNTKGTKDSIFYLKNEIKRIIKDNKLPGFVNSEFYFSMWSPYTFFQVIKGLFINILLMVIPTVLVFFVFKQKLQEMFPNQIFKIVIICCIYFIFIFVFAGIWLIIDKATKKKPEVLAQIKELRKNIKDNEKEIRKITNKTSKEIKDEDFDYTKLDRDIEAGEIEVKNLKEKKQKALTDFSEKMQDEITNKIKNASKSALDEIEKEIENIKVELLSKQKEHDDLKIKNLENGNSI